VKAGEKHMIQTIAGRRKRGRGIGSATLLLMLPCLILAKDILLFPYLLNAGCFASWNGDIAGVTDSGGRLFPELRVKWQQKQARKGRPDNLMGKSSLTKALERWTKEGGDLDSILSSYSNHPVKSKSEAVAICAALDLLTTESGRAGKKIFGSPLHTLAAFFQTVESDEAFEVLKQDGLPRLRSWVRKLLDGQEVDQDAFMFILKILAMYRQHDDVALIAEAARKQINSDGYMWYIIFREFDADHPMTAEMVDILTDPLPTGFISVAYLDMANGLAIAGMLKRHPFDSNVGRKQLETWLRDPDEKIFS
jgi:hypothetical protein